MLKFSFGNIDIYYVFRELNKYVLLNMIKL